MKNFNIRGTEFQIALPKKGLQIYLTGGFAAWTSCSHYTYIEDFSVQDDGNTLYKLQLSTNMSIFQDEPFKHFVLCDNSDEIDEISALLSANGFICTGRGDSEADEKRRIWFLIPTSDFVSTKTSGYNMNNILNI